jgi:hypothetical protein
LRSKSAEGAQLPRETVTPHPALRRSRSFASAFFLKNGRRRRLTPLPMGEVNGPANKSIELKLSCCSETHQLLLAARRIHIAIRDLAGAAAMKRQWRQSLLGSHDGFREELNPSYEIAIKKLSTASQETQP